MIEVSKALQTLAMNENTNEALAITTAIFTRVFLVYTEHSRYRVPSKIIGLPIPTPYFYFHALATDRI